MICQEVQTYNISIRWYSTTTYIKEISAIFLYLTAGGSGGGDVVVGGGGGGSGCIISQC